MSILSSAIKNGPVNEAIRSTSRGIKTIARIDKADDDNNICDITFINKSGNKEEAKKIMVDLRNDNWFPEENDIVIFESDGYSGGTIISKYTEDYKKDIKSKKEIKNDIYPDGDETCGGTIP